MIDPALNPTTEGVQGVQGLQGSRSGSVPWQSNDAPLEIFIYVYINHTSFGFHSLKKNKWDCPRLGYPPKMAV